MLFILYYNMIAHIIPLLGVGHDIIVVVPGLVYRIVQLMQEQERVIENTTHRKSRRSVLN